MTEALMPMIPTWETGILDSIYSICSFPYLFSFSYTLWQWIPLFLQEMNPFCLSANDKDMVLLISNPGPPNLDVST